MLSAYQQIRSLCSTIRHQESNLCEQLKRARNHSEDSLETSSSSSSSSSHVEEISSLQIGLLNDSVLELKGLCHSLMQNSKNCPFCSSSTAAAEHQQKLQTSQHQSEMMTLALKQKESQLKKKDEEIVSLQSQVRMIPICQFLTSFGMTAFQLH